LGEAGRVTNAKEKERKETKLPLSKDTRLYDDTQTGRHENESTEIRQRPDKNGKGEKEKM
jgi:hypothetical protein